MRGMDNGCWLCASFAAAGDGKQGQCRARPPTAMLFGLDQTEVLGRKMVKPMVGNVWPEAEVQATDWCGEWREAT